MSTILIVLFFVFVSSYICLYYIDRRVNYIIRQYVDSEVERLTTNIVSNSINEVMADTYTEDIKENSMGNIYYDTQRINLLKNDITKKIQDNLNNLDNGIIDDYYVFDRIKKGRFKNINNGIVCDISIGSIRNSVLFANIGPSIPIKLVFSSQIKSDITVDVKEYGINNALIKIYLVVSIKEQINMPISSKRKEIVVKEPLDINIIKGDIPNYYGMVNK